MCPSELDQAWFGEKRREIVPMSRYRGVYWQTGLRQDRGEGRPREDVGIINPELN
jgi:hypothetical protein